MGDKHRDTVAVIDPGAAAYTVLLTDLSPEYHGDVHDPIGAGLGAYDEVYSLISACVSQLVADLKTFDGWKPETSSDT